MASRQFLDYEGLEYFASKIVTKKLLGELIQSGTTQYWLEHADVIPPDGAIIVYKDYKQKSDANGNMIDVPCFKVGDGETPIEDLAFLETANSNVQLEHYLQIGDKKFDGSEDVTVPVYGGTISEYLDD